MEPQNIHIHQKENSSRKLLLLLIPSISFAVGLFFAVKTFYQTKMAASTQVLSTRPTPQPPLSYIKIGGQEISVTLAKTDEEQRTGLSGRTYLGESEGMLFVFPPDSRPPFWMKDMLITLDIIWINDGKVVGVSKNIEAPVPGTPDSELTFYLPPEPVDYVLEMRGGFSEKNKVEKETTVEIPQVP